MRLHVYSVWMALREWKRGAMQLLCAAALLLSLMVVRRAGVITVFTNFLSKKENPVKWLCMCTTQGKSHESRNWHGDGCHEGKVSQRFHLVNQDVLGF